MKTRRLTGIALASVLVAFAAAAVFHDGLDARGRIRTPVVTEVVPDVEAGTLTVRGFDFGIDPPFVTLGMAALRVLSAVEDGFVAALPDVRPGTYLLALTWADGARATFQPTLGAVGFRGPEGPEGPRGLDGPAGPAGAAPPSVDPAAGSAPPVDGDHAGGRNTHYGAGALARRTVGLDNAAFGQAALERLTSGHRNAAFGRVGMRSMLTGVDNVAVGTQALMRATTGSSNVAVGANALLAANGSGNVAVGLDSLRGNAAGSGNIAVGVRAGIRNATGSNTFTSAASARPASRA